MLGQEKASEKYRKKRFLHDRTARMPQTSCPGRNNTIGQLQSTNQYNVQSEWHWFVRCDLQIFSGCVCHLEQRHAQSPFLFPIVFGIIVVRLNVN